MPHTHYLIRLNAALLATLLMCLLGGGCTDSENLKSQVVVSAPEAEKPQKPPNYVYQSNQEMAKELQVFVDDIRQRTTQFRNDKRVKLMLERREHLGESPGANFELQLAVQLMRAGESENAILQVDRVIDLLKKKHQQIPAEDIRELNRLKAVSWLRLGEQENCIADHNVDSCLLPIRKEGIHKLKRGSREAVKLYTKLLENDPEELGFRWLLNIAHMTLGEYPDGVPQQWLIAPEVFASEQQFPRFHDVATGSGVAHRALSGGAVLEDLSGDGYLDVVVTSWGVGDQMHYFENDRTGGFVDRTHEAGLDGQVGGLNIVQADYDNDGWVDLLVLRGAWLDSNGEFPNSLLRNRGDGTFEDVTRRAGIYRLQPTHSASWGDFNNDGHLDLFVANESRGRTRYCELYANNGDGTFSEVGEVSGLNHVGFVKGAVWGDFDNDDRLDLFLSQMGEPNVLFRNQGPDENGVWTFSDATSRAGVAAPRRSFPTWFFDYDNDGWQDLVVGSFSSFDEVALDSVVADYLDVPTKSTRAMLYRNLGDGTFEDVSETAGMHRVLLAMGANYGDLDNDGWLDAYFGTGEPSFYTLVPNIMLRNIDGQRFADVSSSGGFGNIQKGHGIAFGDIDSDGDQDIYVNMGGAFSGDVYQNLLFENPGNNNRWVTLRIEGVRSNRSAIGARIKVLVELSDGKSREIHRVVSSGGSFGASSLQQEIGLGLASRITSIEVHWPATGKTDRYKDVSMNKVLHIQEGNSNIDAVELMPLKLHGSGDKSVDHNHHAG